jgi:hypothetical protein
MKSFTISSDSFLKNWNRAMIPAVFKLQNIRPAFVTETGMMVNENQNKAIQIKKMHKGTK